MNSPAKQPQGYNPKNTTYLPLTKRICCSICKCPVLKATICNSSYQGWDCPAFLSSCFFLKHHCQAVLWARVTWGFDSTLSDIEITYQVGYTSPFPSSPCQTVYWAISAVAFQFHASTCLFLTCFSFFFLTTVCAPTLPHPCLLDFMMKMLEHLSKYSIICKQADFFSGVGR